MGDPVSLFHFLLSQPVDDINVLYQSAWCTLAVYQSLDSLSIVATLTRRAVLSAMEKGISADQVRAAAARPLLHVCVCVWWWK